MIFTINPRIIFIGNSNFGVPSLKKMIKLNYNIVSIITNKEKKIIKHGKKIFKSEIKKISIKNNIPILYYEDININKIKYLKIDLQIVISFKKLPKKIWEIPKIGSINLHPSLLPNYRGPSPIQWVIINGEKKTGITTFFINDKIDQGNIILQKEIKIKNDYNFGSLYKKLSFESSNLIIKTIELVKNKKNIILINKNNINKNENKKLKFAPKILKKDRLINWEDSLINIINKIRGLSPYPCAYTFLKTKKKNYI
ncbi:methionyl-tRNA formyltransferase [Candidatus Shikimatogenerans silvanidophilus]|uniref:methionyl-tRNA formyltransferase n=1 Tax=Candidatus Shikimatogenerans silvanidophilus TaxID=2782547 RepID=UPI0021D4424E|nr:methionyl-tRNA formyltransferase [Candidatus Shikimatogenerans silvanidophilus]